jgi:hypothetical protein
MIIMTPTVPWNLDRAGRTSKYNKDFCKAVNALQAETESVGFRKHVSSAMGSSRISLLE